jgi:transcription antitermination factor NusG
VIAENDNKAWFAVQVRARWEQSTSQILAGKGYETLVPLYESERHWGGRTRVVKSPLFSGYVFCRFDVLQRLPILITPGVISIVSRGRIPEAVAASEIEAVQKLVVSGAKAEPWPYLELGERVRIEDTALKGVEGILLAIKGTRRLVVSVSLLQRSVALEIDRALVSPVREKSAVGRSVAEPALA